MQLKAWVEAREETMAVGSELWGGAPTALKGSTLTLGLRS